MPPWRGAELKKAQGQFTIDSDANKHGSYVVSLEINPRFFRYLITLYQVERLYRRVRWKAGHE
jgi:hypothetical protein